MIEQWHPWNWLPSQSVLKTPEGMRKFVLRRFWTRPTLHWQIQHNHLRKWWKK